MPTRPVRLRGSGGASRVFALTRRSHADLDFDRENPKPAGWKDADFWGKYSFARPQSSQKLAYSIPQNSNQQHCVAQLGRSRTTLTRCLKLLRAEGSERVNAADTLL